EFLVAEAGDRVAFDDHVTLVRVEQPDDVLDADGLTRARRPDDHRDLALREPHVQPTQYVVLAERLVDVDELDRVGRARVADDAGVVLELLLLAPVRGGPLALLSRH